MIPPLIVAIQILLAVFVLWLIYRGLKLIYVRLTRRVTRADDGTVVYYHPAAPGVCWVYEDMSTLTTQEVIERNRYLQDAADKARCLHHSFTKWEARTFGGRRNRLSTILYSMLRVFKLRHAYLEQRRAEMSLYFRRNSR